MLSRFAAVLLDVNSTFMFGEDRFGPAHDYFATYRSLGGGHLDDRKVRAAIDACIAHLHGLYVDERRCDSFPRVGVTLAELPLSRDLPAGERYLLEQVIAAHELGFIPPAHADAIRSLARSHRLGIVSNIWSSREPWIGAFRDAEIIDLFDSIVFSSDGSSVKPSPRLFEQVLREMGLTADEAVFVGDNLRCDVGGAARVGMSSIWIDRQGKGIPPGVPVPPAWIVRDLLDLVPVAS